MSEIPVNPVGQLAPYELTPEEIAARNKADVASITCRFLGELSQPWMLNNKNLDPLRDFLKKMVMELI